MSDVYISLENAYNALVERSNNPELPLLDTFVIIPVTAYANDLLGAYTSYLWANTRYPQASFRSLTIDEKDWNKTVERTKVAAQRRYVTFKALTPNIIGTNP